jgi:hypothetical protein
MCRSVRLTPASSVADNPRVSDEDQEDRGNHLFGWEVALGVIFLAASTGGFLALDKAEGDSHAPAIETPHAGQGWGVLAVLGLGLAFCLLGAVIAS